MPLPDERRERGGQTQTTQQSVSPDVAMPGNTSSMGGAFTPNTTKLQINPNQARIVKTGGELAEMFAQVATGAQKGIQAFEQMEKLVEQTRYTEWETEYIRHADTVKGDPQKLKAWMENNDYQPGRHTSKQYWTLRSTVNGKAYEDEQMDFVRDTMRLGAQDNPNERIRRYRQALGRLDENTRAYAELDSAINADVQRQTALNHKISMDMKSVEYTSNTQDRVRMLVDIGGMNPDLTDNEYFKNLMRAANMGLARVTTDGKLLYKDQPVDLNALTPEFNAVVMDDMGKLVENASDKDLVSTQFGSIKYDEGFLAEARRRHRGTGGPGSSVIDAITDAKNAALGSDAGNAASTVTFLGSGISGNVEGPEARDHFVRMSDKYVDDVVKDSNLSNSEKLRALAVLEQSLVDPGDGSAADGAWDALSNRFGMAEGFVSDGMRDAIRARVQDARLEVTVDQFDQAPSPEMYADYDTYQTDLRNFVYANVGLLAELTPDSHIMVRDVTGVTHSIPSDKFRDWAATHRGADIGYIQINQPGNGPVGMDMGATGITTFSYSGSQDENAESMQPSRHQLPSTQTSGRMKAARELKLATMWNKGQELPPDQEVDAFKEAIKRNPNAAMEQLRRRPNGPEMIVEASGSPEVAKAIRGHFAAVFDYTNAENAAEYIGRTAPYAALFDALGEDAARNLYGVQDVNLASPTVSKDQARKFVAARYADLIFDDFPEGTPIDVGMVEARLDAVIAAQKFRKSYGGEAESKFERVLSYDPSDPQSVRHAREAGVLPFAADNQKKILEWLKVETGFEYSTIAAAQGTATGQRALNKLKRHFADFDAMLEVQVDSPSPVAMDKDQFVWASNTRYFDHVLRKSQTPGDIKQYVSPDGRPWQQHATTAFLQSHNLGGDLESLAAADNDADLLRAGTLVRAAFPKKFYGTQEPGDFITDWVAVRALKAYAEDGPQGMYDVLETAVRGKAAPAKIYAFDRGNGNDPERAAAFMDVAVRYRWLAEAVDRFHTSAFVPERNSEFDSEQTLLQKAPDADGSPVPTGGSFRERGFMFRLNPGYANYGADAWAQIAESYNSGGHVWNNSIRMHQPMDSSYRRAEHEVRPLVTNRMAPLVEEAFKRGPGGRSGLGG